MVKKSISDKISQQIDHNTVKYKGVRKRNWGKWVSEIRMPNSRERIWLGSYDTPEKAARAFDAAQFCLRGNLGNLNFPNNPPPDIISRGRSMTPCEIQTAAARFANLATAEAEEEKVQIEERVESIDTQTESMISYSPSVSDVTVQIDSEVKGVEELFYEQFGLNESFGSGNYISDFGYFAGLEDYIEIDYCSLSRPEPDNFDYGVEDTYDNSLYQHSCLWNF